MPVLDQSYRRWTGTPASHLRRVLVIPRFDLMEILAKRTWLLAWLACLVPPLILGLLVYLAANVGKLSAFIPVIPPELHVPLPPRSWYQGFLWVQCWMLSGFAVLIGPPLATRDFANGAMPLYLSKSLRRWDYVAGRCAVLALLLSLASWIPYLAVFVLEYGVADAAWRKTNWDLGGAIIVATVPTVALLTALIIAAGAVVQRTNLARAALLFILLGVKPLAGGLQFAVDTPTVTVVSPTHVTARLREWALAEKDAAPDAAPASPGARAPRGGPAMNAGLALAALLGWLAAGALVIARRVRPVEVVK